MPRFLLLSSVFLGLLVPFSVGATYNVAPSLSGVVMSESNGYIAYGGGAECSANTGYLVVIDNSTDSIIGTQTLNFGIALYHSDIRNYSSYPAVGFYVYCIDNTTGYTHQAYFVYSYIAFLHDYGSLSSTGTSTLSNSSTTALWINDGNIMFGLGILIVIACIYLIAYISNTMFGKKPWLR